MFSSIMGNRQSENAITSSVEKETLLKDDETDSVSVSKEVESIKSEYAREQQLAKAKALSMSFMKSFSGLCCDDCEKDPFNSIHKNPSDQNHNADGIAKNNNYRMSISNISSISEETSTISPLVVAPMMSKNLDAQQPGTIETMIGEYMCFCRFYKVHYNSGILTALRFSTPCLRPSGAFHDSDMLALTEMLLRHANGALRHVTRLDFAIVGKEGKHERNKKLVGFTSHGALSLAKALQTTKYIREVYLPRNRIGPYGASALFMACRMNPSIEDLNLRRCRIGKRGALAFCEIILLGEKADGDQGHGLVNVNLRLNQIGHHGTEAIESLLRQRSSSDQIVVHLEGNLIFPEIMNSVTHCAGVVLSLFGGHLLSLEVRATTLTHRMSCAIYTGSLLSLYLSSTLFHSFFALVNTRHIFQVMDKCAIYILIAGSYTPFMQVLLNDQPMYSFGLLGYIWTCCILGVSVEAMFPNWKYRPKFSLLMYLGMGWSCVICLPQMAARGHAACVYMILLGGVAYTAGVPFYVRNNNLDHAIWHLFVMAGSIVHWLAVYIYVTGTPLQYEELIEN